MKVIETKHLILRTWKAEDAEPYFQINQDPKVLEFLRGPISMQEARDFIDSANKQFEELGFTLWAVEEKASAKLMGFIGIAPVKHPMPFCPAIEIAWRLGAKFWGRGYATEGAKAALKYGFKKCGLKEIVSLTSPRNLRSIRVMEKIGMKHDLQGDFAHPKLPLDHPLSKHVLYRINSLTDS